MANSIKSVATSFLTCFGIIEKICKFSVIVRLAAKNDKRCEHVLSQTELIKEILIDLHRLELSRTVISAIRKLEVRLKNCDQYMAKMSDRSFPRTRDFLQSAGYCDDLEQLRKEVDSALLALNTSMLVQSLADHQGANNSVWSSDLEETGLIPGKPHSLRVVKRAHNRIQVVWDAPSENPEAVSKYEVQYRRRWNQWDDKECATVTAFKCVVDGLSSDTHYWFRVRAVNTKAYPGRYSEDVCAGTKTSPAAQFCMLICAAVAQVIGILLYFALFPLIFCLAPGFTAVVILESIVIFVIHYTCTIKDMAIFLDQIKRILAIPIDVMDFVGFVEQFCDDDFNDDNMRT